MFYVHAFTIPAGQHRGRYKVVADHNDGVVQAMKNGKVSHLPFGLNAMKQYGACESSTIEYYTKAEALANYKGL